MKRLKVLAPSDAIILRRIFSYKKPFYDISYMNIPPTMEDESELIFSNDIVYAESKFPSVFCYNINCFGRLSGFEIILGILSNSETKAKEFKFSKRLCKSISNMTSYMLEPKLIPLILP